MKNNIMVIYHANCPDGFGAAWSFWNRYGNSIEYYAANHGADPPDVSGKDVFIVDFSYKRDILIKMNDSAKSLVLIDHHLSAEKDVGDLDFCNFDMNHSGAYLAWSYLFGDESIPPIVSYVEDRDLWKWELPNSNFILSAIDSYPKEFSTWSGLNDMLSLDHTSENASWGFEKLKAEGEAILRYKQNLIDSLIKNSFRCNILGFDVPVVNAPFFQSELASMLSDGESFAAAYYFNGYIYRVSLRSEDDGEDVSEIASKFGGGGHRCAAAFNIDSIEDFILNNGE
jgi:oligoribonuclease NrnB/cAMP/cGMP phosphodiesterase (DHH superfamily)